MDFACQIDPGHVGPQHRQPLHLRLVTRRACLLLTPCHLATSLSEHESPGRPNVDSDLGESYGSLANV